mgnify:CR=1 FL=1
MLNWLASLYADWTGERQAGGAPERTARPADDTGDPDEEATVEAEGASAREADSPDSWRDLLDGDEVSRRTIRTEFGIQPHEFLAWLVRDAGGRMWQTDLVKATGWSKSTVSRYLGGLEADGTIERVRIGRRNLVGMPTEMPDAVPTADEPSIGTPSADTPASSWAPEADERA